MWQTRKKKREDQIKKEKRKGQIEMIVSLALARLRMIKAGFKGPEETATRVRRPKKALI